MIISSSLKNIKNINLIKKKIPLIMITNPLPGVDIGIPLTIFQQTYSSLHYGSTFINLKGILIQYIVGFYAYGGDRYLDAQLYQHLPFNSTKTELYEYINDNSSNIGFSLFLSKILIFFILSDNLLLYSPFLVTIETIPYYNEIKKNIGVFKPFYIAILWTASAILLPSIINDQNYSILLYPLDYLPCTLTLFAASNFADIKDIEEDKINKIDTLPVVYGAINSKMISLFSLFLSSLMIAFNPHFMDSQNVASFLEVQNALISIISLI
jgi:hypothetical protein